MRFCDSCPSFGAVFVFYARKTATHFDRHYSNWSSRTAFGLSVLLAVLFAAHPVNVLGQKKVTNNAFVVVGRVVDNNGYPFPGVGLCLEPAVYKSKAFDRFIRCHGSASDGSFVFKKGRSLAGQLHFLFVYSDDSDASLSTLLPPFDRLRDYDKSFDGVPVRLGTETLIDVGDVKVQFWYGEAHLNFSALAPLSDQDWENLYLRIRNSEGHMVYESTLSKDTIYVKAYIDRSNATLRISLPHGRWSVEALWDDKVRARSAYFTLSKEQKLEVKMEPIKRNRAARER